MKKLIIRVLIGLFVLVFLGYAGVIVYLKTQETKLVFYEAYGQPVRTVSPDSTHLKYQRIELQSEDGIKLTGWVILSEKDTFTSPWLLFCHGNASDISYIDYIARYKLFTNLGLNVLTFDYRGFGESAGTPSETGLYKDAMAIYNYLTVTKHIPSDRIIIYGHSLGTGVAIDLATRVPVAALYDKALPPKSFLEIKGSHDPAPMESKESFCNGLSSFLAGTTAHIDIEKP